MAKSFQHGSCAINRANRKVISVDITASWYFWFVTFKIMDKVSVLRVWSHVRNANKSYRCSTVHNWRAPKIRYWWNLPTAAQRKRTHSRVRIQMPEHYVILLRLVYTIHWADSRRKKIKHFLVFCRYCKEFPLLTTHLFNKMVSVWMLVLRSAYHTHGTVHHKSVATQCPVRNGCPVIWWHSQWPKLTIKYVEALLYREFILDKYIQSQFRCV